MPYLRKTLYKKRPRFFRRKPIRKFARKTTRRIPYKKKLLSSSIMPDMAYRNLTYSKNGTYNSPLALSYIKSFRCNSLYDPDVAVGGGQPLGFASLVPTFYQRYTVMRFKVDGWFTNQSGTQKPVGIFAVFTNVASPSLATIEQLQALPHTKYIMMAPPTSTPGTFPAKSFHTGWMSIPKLLGRPFDYSDDTAPYNNNPNQELYCHLLACTLDSSVGTSCCNGFYNLKITYGAKLHEVTPVTS